MSLNNIATNFFTTEETSRTFTLYSLGRAQEGVNEVGLTHADIARCEIEVISDTEVIYLDPEFAGTDEAENAAKMKGVFENGVWTLFYSYNNEPFAECPW